MIPQPGKIQYLKGNVDKETPVEEKICPQLAEEEYHLHIAGGKVLLEGGSGKALFYARTTLGQLRLLHGDVLPCVDIQDKPAYAYRSFHIDCARHYFTVGELKKMIRMSAEFKLNYFHWHISDDQGWRIESKCFPKLHEVGSAREGDHFGNYDSDEPEPRRYYTRAEVKEIISYCAQFGIEVVPEVDMPGHVLAVLAAYPELSCRGEEVKVGMRAGIFKDIFCAGKEDTYTFIEKLLDELTELFPCRYFHIGGDEAPKEMWNTCPHCQKRMKEEHLNNAQELQGYMENRIASYLQAKGRIPIVWNEAVYGGNLDKEVVVQLWTEDKGNKIKEHLDKGGKAVLSMVDHCYCDYPYGMHSLRDVYGINMSPEELGERGADSVLGTECLVWTEFIRDGRRLEEMCWPRFAASAEAGWCGMGRPGYEDFCGRLKALFPLFELRGIHATGEDGWTPDKAAAAEQTAEFQRNFPPEDLEEVRKAQEAI